MASELEQVRLYVDMASQYGQISVAAWAAQLSVTIAAVGYAITSRGRRDAGHSPGVCAVIGVLLAGFYAINLWSLAGLDADVDRTSTMVRDVWDRFPSLLHPAMRELIAPVASYRLFGITAPQVVVQAAVLDVIATLLSVGLLSRLGRADASAAGASRRRRMDL